VDDAFRVGVVDGVGDLGEELEAVAGAEVVLGGVVGEREALDELHGEERDVVSELVLRDAGFVELGDAGVLVVAEDLGFVGEAAGELGLGQ